VFAVYEKVLPKSIVPLLKEVPSSEVTVWAIASLFVHVTVDPTLTVVVAGKAIPAILTSLGFVPVEFPIVFFDLEHERKPVERTAASIIAKYFVFIISFCFVNGCEFQILT
jgi:hypothetical protein